MSDQTYLEDIVSTGLDWLDETRPGWARAIDLETFNIRMTNTCIVGQLNSAGDYEYIGRMGDFTEAVYDEHKGFDLPCLHEMEADEGWSYLQHLWVDAIEERLEGMRIGEPERTIIIDPVEAPVPPERMPEPEPEPEKVPDRTPEREPEKVPA